MTQLTQDILEKIKKEDIKPKPKWYFLFMHALLWLSVIVTILLGALAVAITLRHLLTAPWDLLWVAIPNRAQAFIVMLPYVWLIFIGVTVFLATQLFKHTKKGYRFRPVYVVLASILLSLILGIGLYSSRIDQPVHDQLTKHLPPYAQWQEKLDQHFVAPNQGVLAGKIRRIQPEEQIILIDFKRDRWLVDVQNANGPDFFVGMPVGMLGEKTGEYQFKAKVIKPIDPRRFGPESLKFR